MRIFSYVIIPNMETLNKPKVFISYSHTSQQHAELVKSWADDLLHNGVDVVIDIYDLKEGHDKYAFMERMVTDPSITNVLVISDMLYAEKADQRKAGVGTETQIISKEVYDKLDQSQFIPIITQLSDKGDPYLPTFLQSRIWLDFSSPEKVNENWERLIKLLFGVPIYEKPPIGKPPLFITQPLSFASSPAIFKFNMFRQALLEGKRGLPIFRQDFLDACIQYADGFRIKKRPSEQNFGERVLEDCRKLKVVRDHFVDWILLEGRISRSDEFKESIIRVLEQLLELKYRPRELTSWNEIWFEAPAVFVYETFLYIIASLIKVENYEALHEIFSSLYILPETERQGSRKYVRFDIFYGYSESLQSVLSTPNHKLHSPAAELIKKHADRSDISFRSIIEAELLVFLMVLITDDTWNWYPGTLHYESFASDFPLFIRATNHKYFIKLSKITGIDNADTLRDLVKNGQERHGVNSWPHFRFGGRFWEKMNMDKLDTLK